MSNLTEQAIKTAFLQLLEQYPLNKISVRSIVETCGINRNSFYYHFQDIPSLIEEIVTDAVNALIQKYPSISSLEECCQAAFHFIREHKRAMMHLYQSVNREVYERYLMQICEYVVTTYFNTAFGAGAVSAENQEIFILFTKCELFGSLIEWMNHGMSDDALEKLQHLLSLCHGLSEELIRRGS